MPEENRVKAISSPAPVPGLFLSEGQQEVRRKGWNGRRERVGGNGVYQVAGGLPSGQQLVKVSWLEKFTPGRREAADLLGRRTPRQVSPAQTAESW